MSIPHLVKVGLFGRVGRFTAVDGRLFRRDQNVICRTSRGLEVGSVVCSLQPPANGGEADVGDLSDGELLRKVTPDDARIIERIDRFRDKAFLACSRLLQQRQLNAVLVDVEHLFDGQSVFFYFLGDVPREVQDLTEELAVEYEKKVRFKKFTETLVNGCGPDCGTDSAGCSTGGCSTCSVNGACKSAV